MKATDIREMTPAGRKSLLAELKKNLMVELGMNNRYRGGSTTAMRIRPLKKDIARVKTIMREEGD